MKRPLAILCGLALLLASEPAAAQIVSGTQIATVNGQASETLFDGNNHYFFGFQITSPVPGFGMMWPASSAPSSGALSTPPAICVPTAVTPSGMYAAATGQLIGGQGSILSSATVSFSTASDCMHYTPSTNVQISMFYQ